MSHNDLNSALNAWRNCLGSEYCITDEATLGRFSKTTFQISHRVAAILKPKTIIEVQECVKIANTYKIPLHPISLGKNYGYGSATPPGDGFVLIFLERMNQIFEFSEKFATVTIEPGVTQIQLYQYLQSRKSNLCMDATGASETASIVGNTMERGFGHTPFGNHFEQVISMEVVLPNGDIINTGFNAFLEAKAGKNYRYPPGPAIDGIFFQSNLGIVTKMTFALMAKPECFESFYFTLKSDNSIQDVIDALQPLRLNGTINSALHIGNDLKALNSFSIYPWEKTLGQRPISDQELEELREQYNIGTWNGSGGISGSKARVREVKALMRNALQGKVHSLLFVNDFMINMGKRFPWIPKLVTGKDVSNIYDKVEAIYQLEQGIPCEIMMKSTYWRKKEMPDKDFNPERDNCGLIWFAPLSPSEGKHAIALKKICDEVMLKYGFDPMVSITLLTERAMISVMSICYDRSTSGEDEKALHCHAELIKRCANDGYFAYRYGTQAMGHYPAYDPNYQKFLQQLKSSIDPNHIISPGRYGL